MTPTSHVGSTEHAVEAGLEHLHHAMDPTNSDDWGAFDALRCVGALGCTLWTGLENDVIESAGFGESDPVIQLSAQKLANKAIASRSMERIVLARSSQVQILAVPIDGSSTSTAEALTVVVPFEYGPAEDDLIQSVSECLRRRASTNRQEETLSVPIVDDAVMSWSSLRVSLTARLKADWRWCQKRRKRLAVIALMVLGIGLLPVRYAIRCDVTCEPSLRRFVSATIDGKIESVEVRPGQRVRIGQLLCALNGDEIKNELSALRASEGQQEQKLRASMATGDHSAAAATKLELDFLKNKIDILTRRLQSLEIRSPIDGVIVSGDMERATGASVSLGDELFEVASLKEMVAEFAVPESDILRIEEGMEATIQWDAMSGTTSSAKIDQIHLRSEMRDGESVFVAQANARNADGQLRPGMSGTARIWAGRRSLGWLLFSRPITALRQATGW